MCSRMLQSGIWNMNHEKWKMKYEIWKMKYEKGNMKYVIWNTKYEICSCMLKNALACFKML